MPEDGLKELGKLLLEHVDFIKTKLDADPQSDIATLKVNLKPDSIRFRAKQRR